MWDTAGQDRFKTITTQFYRGASGILLVYDVTDMTSFENLKTWRQEIDKYADEKCIRMIVGNKADLTSKRVVDYKTAKAFADQYGFAYTETSAKTASNVEQTFMTMTAELKTQAEAMKLQIANPDATISIGETAKVSDKGPCC
ncbi:hypothetical protein ACJMK2_036983 [Sinanodonta woodiana]|uniref:Uncharacterized protein n=1 Tax=Sinanodonta woodiana TaxID=1069815 RepID=A0ABD3WIW9_SINWO